MCGGNFESIFLMLTYIKKLIKEYYRMSPGEYIKNHLDEVLFFSGEIHLKITHRALKHVVEQRKSNTYSEKRIYQIFQMLLTILEKKNYQIIKNREISNTFILVEQIFTGSESICVVIELIHIDSNSYYIKTGFFRDVKRIKKLL